MKKYLLLLIIFILVGCKSKSNANEIKCEKNYNQGYEFKEEVIATMENSKVASLKSTLTFNSKEEAELYCTALKSYKNYGNSNLDYDCSNKTITINNYDVLSEVDVSIIGMTRDEFIELFTENKYACK